MFNISNKNSLLIKSKLSNLQFKSKSKKKKGIKSIEKDFGIIFDKNNSLSSFFNEGKYGGSLEPSLSSVTLSI